MPKRSLTTEARAFNEYLALRHTPVFRGEGVPRGDGRPVLALPGLFGNDFYLRPLRDWLRRVNYYPLLSMISLNAGCPNDIRRRVERSLPPVIEEDQRIAIIGHSRGGMLAKALAGRLGDRCSHLIALGSPVGGILRGGKPALRAMASGQRDEGLAAGPVVEAGRLAMRMLSPKCEMPDCDCEYVQGLLAPLSSSTRTFAIRSENDPVVSPETCIMDGAENVTVKGTHAGLAVNPDVYSHLARMLAT